VQEIFRHLNKEYISAKDLLLSQYPNYSPEEEEEIWKQVTEVYLLPLIEAVYQLQVNYITSENAHAVILPVFGEFPKHIQQSTGLGQKILALNQGNQGISKGTIEPLQDSQSHKTQLCKSSAICYPKPFEINFIRLKALNDVK
jgi:hypothetical protein